MPVAEILSRAAELSERYRQLDDPTDKHQIISRVLRKITLRPNAIAFEVSPSALLAMLSGATPKQKRDNDADDTHASHADVASRFNAHGANISRILPMAFFSPKITGPF